VGFSKRLSLGDFLIILLWGKDGRGQTGIIIGCGEQLRE
jgi:hypothetical protein